jgi:hypothetical protein
MTYPVGASAEPERSLMRIGINGSDKLVRPNIDEILADIEASEAAGFATYWLAQT